MISSKLVGPLLLLSYAYYRIHRVRCTEWALSSQGEEGKKERKEVDRAGARPVARKTSPYYLGHASLVKMRIVPAEQTCRADDSRPSSSCPAVLPLYYYYYYDYHLPNSYACVCRCCLPCTTRDWLTSRKTSRLSTGPSLLVFLPVGLPTPTIFRPIPEPIPSH